MAKKSITCLVCKKEFTPKHHANNVKFCSIKCRNSTYAEYRADFQRKRMDEKAKEASPNKIKCLICGRSYRQVGTHIVQRHGITAREYREEYGLEVKKGMLPPDLREHKGEQALSNGTWKNLKKGQKFWFKPGDKQAGRYKRSSITEQRLKELHKFTKLWQSYHKEK